MELYSMSRRWSSPFPAIGNTDARWILAGQVLPAIQTLPPPASNPAYGRPAYGQTRSSFAIPSLTVRPRVAL